MATATKAKTNTYIWAGRDKKGQVRKGEVAALNEQLVRNFLQKQGINPTRVSLKPKPIYESKGKIKTKDIVTFTRQMTTMLKAGMSITQSLQLVADGVQKPIALKEMILDLKQEVEGGSSFSSSLSKYPLLFSGLYISLVSAGEEAGVLDGTMDKIATNLEKGQTIKKKVKKAMMYPIIVLCFAIGLAVLLLTFVIPKFEEFFSDFGKELPMLTQKVVELSHLLRSHGGYVFIGIVAFFFIFFYFKKRNRAFQRKLSRIGYKLPLFGKISKTAGNAGFARTLSVLFQSGVPLVTSLKATAPATGSVVMEEATFKLATDVENGSQLNFAMQESGVFQPFSIQMVGIGEESGNLDEMLAKVADFYEEELDFLIDNLTTMIEPLVISLVAAIVGVLIIAMYLPIFGLADVVG